MQDAGLKGKAAIQSFMEIGMQQLLHIVKRHLQVPFDQPATARTDGVDGFEERLMGLHRF